MLNKRQIARVLVVDDDDRVLASAERALGRERKVFTTPDPAAARELARRERPHLAIVDLQLESSSGIDLVRQLRADDADLAIVLFSGYHSLVTTADAVRAGADLIFCKPMTFREIVRRVEAPTSSEGQPKQHETLATVEWEHLQRVLADCDQNISLAARELGISRSSLHRKLLKKRPRS